jgi:hypothetical protein
MPGSDDAKEYLARAKHCLDIASVVDSSRRLVLLEMAQAWSRLAVQAERNQRTHMVYETPGKLKGNGHAQGPGD